MPISSADLPAPPLGVAIAVPFITHARPRYKTFTPRGAADYFGSLGVSGFLAPFSIAIATLGGLALILGVGTPAIAVLPRSQRIRRIVRVHGRTGFWSTNEGGVRAYPVLWIVCLIAMALIGSGAYALWPI